MYQIEELEKWKDKPEKIVYRYSASGDKWICLILKKGCVAGEHYHKGLVASKNPEINIILKGKVEYYLKDLKSGKPERSERRVARQRYFKLLFIHSIAFFT